MSEMETWKGVLKPTGKTLEEFMSDINLPNGYDKNNKENIEEFFIDAFYREKIVVGGFVYNIEKENLSEYNIFESKKLDNGDIEFLIRYYNGGCSFDEAIETAINKND